MPRWLRREASGWARLFSTQRVVDLPLNGRNVTDLIGLAGASVQTGTTQSRWFSNLPVISIGGSPAVGGAGGSALLGTDYSLDGANHLNYLSGSTMPIAFPDAVQEFKTETSGQSAQRGAATSVSIVTRSGSNEYHGGVFEFLRNDGFGSAREYFSPVNSTYKRNQFGGTLGGPIRKDKVFFFGGYQGTTIRQALPSTTIVPTPQVMAGDWTTFSGASCNGGTAKTLRGGTVNNLASSGAVFSGGQISPSFYTPQAVYIANAYLNNLAGLQPNNCGSLTYQVPTHENDHQFVGRVDYPISSTQSIFVRTLVSHVGYPAALDGCTFDRASEKLSGSCLSKNILNSGVSGEDQLAQSHALGHTWLIDTTKVNSFRVAFNRTAATLTSSNLFTLCDAGVNMWCGGTPGQLGASSISGGFGFSTGLGNGDYWNGYNVALNDDISWVKGSHQMSFGGSVWQGRVNEFNHFSSAGSNILYTGQTSGMGMSDFLLGNISSMLQGLPNSYVSRQNFVNLYFTDTWKLSNRLTFSFGVRWDPFLPQQITNGQISNFDLGRFHAAYQEPNSRIRLRDCIFPGIPASRISPQPIGNGGISIRGGAWLGIRRLTGRCHCALLTPLATPMCPASHTRTRVAPIPGAAA